MKLPSKPPLNPLTSFPKAPPPRSKPNASPSPANSNPALNPRARAPPSYTPRPTKPAIPKPTISPPPPPPPPRSSSPFSPNTPLTRTILLTTSSIIFGCATLLFIRDNIVTIDVVRGSSMAPSLSPLSHEQGGLGNERVIISKWFPARDVKRGDVVTFWKPHRRGEVSIKRVVGVGGDVVRVGRGRERGTGTGEKGYSAGGEEKDGMEGGGMGIGMEKRVGLFDGLGDANSSEQTSPGTVVVPHGHIWVEGDNWRKSYDSNDFGPISKALVDGRAVRVWRDGWWRQVGDLREDRDRRHAGRVLREGGSEVPGAFLE